MSTTVAASEPRTTAPTLRCGRAGCGRCCACGDGPDGGARRLIAFPVRGEKRWLCPACLTRALEAARPRTGS